MKQHMLALLGVVLAVMVAGNLGISCFPTITPSGGDTTGGDTTGGDTTGGDTTGGDTTGGDTTGDGSGGTAALQIVKTAIPVRHDAGLYCGNDLIAFGTESASSSIVGVSYVIPSTSPTAGTAVTDSALYDNSDFAVAGRTIFLVGSASSNIAFQVAVFNVDTGTTTTIPVNQIRLASIPVAPTDPGNIRADGDYCVVICDANSVDDGKVVKVIDVSGDTPTVVSFTQNPAERVQQVDVDAASGKVVAATNDKFYVYDISNPTVAPVVIDVADGIDDVVIQMNSSYLVALNDANYPKAFLVNLANNQVVNLTDSEGTYDVAIGASKFGFFADFDADDSVGGSQRAAVGTASDATFSKAPLDQRIDGSTTNNGTIGFAGSMCVVPGGTYQNYVFLGDSYLQYSPGTTSFTVPADPNGQDTYGTPAWDVDCSSSVLGFKTAASRSSNTDTTLGYARLN